MSHVARGAFITVEGGDGAGKSTQVRLLAEYLKQMGHDLVLTREPGGSDNAERIREFLLSTPESPWSAWTEAFLIAAARREHVKELIAPSLKGGKTVLCDRFSDSTIAYQGYGRGLPLSDLDQLIQIAEQGTTPDLTIILDIDPAIAADRIAARGQEKTVFESEDMKFRMRARKGFLDLSRHEPERYRTIDASQAQDVVTAAIKAAVDGFFAERQAELAG
jgi:dTMP kinase